MYPNIGSHLTQLSLVPAAALTATGNGAAIDLLGDITVSPSAAVNYDGDLVCLLDSAAGTGTTPTLDIKLQHSDDNSTFTDVTNGAFAQVTGTGSLQKLTVDVGGLKRYVRAVHTLGGTTPSFVASLQAVVQNKYPA